METCMHDLIFVYGSLLTRIAHPRGEQLRREAALVGTGHVGGQLYRVSWYPCMVASDVAGDVVHGEVYRLRQPTQTIAWLDAYEGIVPGPASVAASDEYARVLRPVAMADGTNLQAWMYVYQRSAAQLTRVPSGQWEG
jgi:gamma-glutamylcyclotransferase (GGCT)/AIG2-like uncharacterized protein YtfP